MEVERAAFNNMTLRDYLNCFPLIFRFLQHLVPFRQSLLPWSKTELTSASHLSRKTFPSRGCKKPDPQNWRSVGWWRREQWESASFSGTRQCLEPRRRLVSLLSPTIHPFSHLQCLRLSCVPLIFPSMSKRSPSRASLVAQWLRIHLPMQGTWVRTLVQEDPTCHGATKPGHHNYWACSLEPVSHNCWARTPQLLKPVRLEPVLCNKRSRRNEKPTHHNEDPTQPKINK